MPEIDLNKNPAIDPESFGLGQAQAARVAALDEKELEFAYRLKARAEHINTAKSHCDVILSEKESWLDQLTDADYARMAELFEKRRDGNFPDNAVWAQAVTDYIAEKFGDLP